VLAPGSAGVLSPVWVSFWDATFLEAAFRAFADLSAAGAFLGDAFFAGTTGFGGFFAGGVSLLGARAKIASGAQRMRMTTAKD